MPGSPSRPLRLALAANALFSTACGLALLLAGPRIAPALGEIPPVLAVATGAALIVFAALVAAVAVDLRIGRALAISALDIAWVVGTVPLVFVPGLLSATGVGAVLAVAALVGALAAGQLAAIRFLLRETEGGPGTHSHCVRVRTRAPADALWAVVADMGGIAGYSSSLASSRMRGDCAVGVGAVRDCADHAGTKWAEEVERFDPAGRRLVVRFRTEEPGFPFPVSTLSGGWRVAEDGDGSVVEVWWSLTPASRLGWLLVALMTVPLDRTMIDTIGRMAEVAEGRGTVDAAPGRPAGGVRRALRLAYC